jgi:hypothetical protein
MDLVETFTLEMMDSWFADLERYTCIQWNNLLQIVANNVVMCVQMEQCR